jgi:hypothetical protein
MDEQTASLLGSFQVEVPQEDPKKELLSKDSTFLATMPLTGLKQVKALEQEIPGESKQTLTLQCIKEKLSSFVSASSLHRGQVLLHGAGHLMHVPESALVWIDAQIWDNLVHSLLDWNQYLILASFIVFVDSWASDKSLELKLKAQASMAIAEGRCLVAWMIDPEASKMRVYTQGCLPSPKKADDSWKSLKADSLFPGFEVTPQEIDSALGRETQALVEPDQEVSS